MWNKAWQAFFYPLWILLHPRFWAYTGEAVYDEALDANINHLLDEGVKFSLITQYEAMFGPYRLWIANYAYASFSTKLPQKLSDGTSFIVELRPSRRTMHRLKNAFVEQEPVLAFLFD